MSSSKKSPVTSVRSGATNDMRVIDLKRELKARGLPVSGRKAELIERLNAYTKQQSQVKQCDGKQLRGMSLSPLREQYPLHLGKGDRRVDVDEDEEEFVAVVEVEQGCTQDMGQQQQDEEQQHVSHGAGHVECCASHEHVLWSPPLLKQQQQRVSPTKRALFGPDDEQQQQQQPSLPEDLSLSSSGLAFEPTTPNRENDTSLSKLPPSALRSSCTPGKKARISFGQVEVRKFRVSHGGATSTPSKGAYPIGLSWEVAAEEVKPLDSYESEANRFRSPSRLSASPRRFSEKERRRLLEKVDARSYFEKQASFETEKEELKQLRRARANIGCHCTSPSSCGTSRCVCFKEGLACNDDTCRCTCANCVNPKRYNFDQDRIDNYRRRRILEAPYVSDEMPAVTATSTDFLSVFE